MQFPTPWVTRRSAYPGWWQARSRGLGLTVVWKFESQAELAITVLVRIPPQASGYACPIGAAVRNGDLMARYAVVAIGECGSHPANQRVWLAKKFRTKKGCIYPTTVWASTAVDGTVIQQDWSKDQGFINVARDTEVLLVLVRADMASVADTGVYMAEGGMPWWNEVGMCWSPHPRVVGLIKWKPESVNAEGSSES